MAVHNFGTRHTAKNIADFIDNFLHGLKQVKPSLEFVLVHDAAANMEAVQEKSKHLTASITCADHLFNTSLDWACRGNARVLDALEAATMVATRVHHSPLAVQAVKAKAETEGVIYVKIITPVKTRWNSRFMMIESILKMETVFTA